MTTWKKFYRKNDDVNFIRRCLALYPTLNRDELLTRMHFIATKKSLALRWQTSNNVLRTIVLHSESSRRCWEALVVVGRAASLLYRRNLRLSNLSGSSVLMRASTAPRNNLTKWVLQYKIPLNAGCEKLFSKEGYIGRLISPLIYDFFQIQNAMYSVLILDLINMN